MHGPAQRSDFASSRRGRAYADMVALLPEKATKRTLSRKRPNFLSPLPSQPNPLHHTPKADSTTVIQDALANSLPSFRLQLPNIQSHKINDFNPTHPPASALPPEVDLNFDKTSAFSNSSSSPQTATITSQDFPVFTTDNQQKWLPQRTSPLPDQPVQQQPFLPPTQQDFVLFDKPSRPQPRRPAVRPTIAGQQGHRRHSAQNHYHRVQRIIQSSVNQHPSSSLPNAQFYASSAPSSSVSLGLQGGPARPPVPLFNSGTASLPQTPAGMELSGKYSRLPGRSFRDSQRSADIDGLDEYGMDMGASATAYSSPAMPTGLDFSSSSSNTNIGTVSPQDLLINEPYMSAPNSTALTALTSPSVYNESPEFNDNFDVSPNFGSSDFDNGSNDAWFPLFPQETLPEPTAPVNQSPSQKSDELEAVELASSASRRKSGHSPTGRHSSVSGVNSRRRDKPLPPIIIEDPSDTVAMKRARNTLAARKSRERKAQRLDELEEKISKLEAERDHWKKIALERGGGR